MATLVPDDGTGAEPLCVIGEAPGPHEVAQRRPFVGPSGYRIQGWIAEVGLTRRDVYWTNVYPYQAPQNKIANVPATEIEPWQAMLHDRLARLRGPVILVPTGDLALRTIVPRKGLTITKARGSIYSYTDLKGRVHKVIPTIHPAATFRTPSWERRCRLDWRRIAEDLAFPTELRLPEREHFIKPTLGDLAGFYEDASRLASTLAVDIETPRKRMSEMIPGKPLKSGKTGKPHLRKWLGPPHLVCVGYSYEPTFSITIPTTAAYWGADLTQAWAIIAALNHLPQPKVLQNGLFDAYWLTHLGAPLRQFRWDTRWLHHALDALDAHSLAYMASVDTREPYWKDDAKEGEGEAEWVDQDTFWKYCGKDAAVTLELANRYLVTHMERDTLAYYLKHYYSLFAPLLRMMLRGLRVNPQTRKSAAATLQSARIIIEDRLTAIAGENLYGTTDLSNKKLAAYLYGTLKLPKQFDRATKAVTTKEVVVRKLMLMRPQTLGSIHEATALAEADDLDLASAAEACDKAGPLILLHRRKSKLASFLKEGMVDPDGIIRTQYGFTETLRLTSGKNPKRTGANLQNQDRALRHVFVPEPSKFFLEVDASQGEDRIVKCLTRSERLIARALMPPWENDEHVRAAQVIWPGLQITPERRYLGKRTRHAGNYGLMGLRFSEELSKDGVVVDPGEAQGMIDTLLDKDTPEVRVWQQETRAETMRNRCIADSWGQVWDFTWERLDDELYRFAYAARPQAELVKLVNHYGLLPLDKAIQKGTFPCTVLHHQNHDSLLMSTVREEAYDVAQFLREGIGKPRVYAGTKLSMPVELKLGYTWALPLEFKKFPTREEFYDRVDAMICAGQ